MWIFTCFLLILQRHIGLVHCGCVVRLVTRVLSHYTRKSIQVRANSWSLNPFPKPNPLTYGQRTPFRAGISKSRICFCAHRAQSAHYTARSTQSAWIEPPMKLIWKHNKYTARKCFYLENKIPMQSQWPKPHFLPTRWSMQLQWNCVYVLCQLIQKRICTAWVRQIEERVKITASPIGLGWTAVSLWVHFVSQIMWKHWHWKWNLQVIFQIIWVWE